MSLVCHSICVLLEDITLERWTNSSQYAKVQSFFYWQNASTLILPYREKWWIWYVSN